MSIFFGWTSVLAAIVYTNVFKYTYLFFLKTYITYLMQ